MHYRKLRVRIRRVLNMSKPTVIHIYYRTYSRYFPAKDSKYYYLEGWSSQIAKQTIKHTDKYRIENWRPEIEIKKPEVYEVDKITCRLFPAKYTKYFGYWSPLMLKEIKNQAQKNKILIHYHVMHDNLLYLISWLFKNVPIVIHHHGGYTPLFRLKYKKHITALLRYLIEKITFKNIDQFFVSVKMVEAYLKHILDDSKVSFGPVIGIDFNVFKPKNKTLARKKLHLPLDAKILLYVGKCDNLKGLDTILKAFRELRKTHNIELLIVGDCSSQDPLYKDVVSSGARICGHISYEIMPWYYSAADAFISLPPVESAALFLGTGISLLESLACGTPAISTGLIHFPPNEWEKLGKAPQSYKEVISCIVELLEGRAMYPKCREIAMKYYQWKNIISCIVETYDRLFKIYYNNE